MFSLTNIPIACFPVAFDIGEAEHLLARDARHHGSLDGLRILKPF